MTKEEKEIEKDFSQSWLIYRLITHETKPCTYWELENKYSISQAYKMYEILDVYDTRKKIEIERANKNKG